MTGGSAPSTPGGVEIQCRVLRGANQVITDLVLTPVSFDSVLADTSGMWSAGAPTRITIAYDGFYLVEAMVGFEVTLSVGGQGAQLFKNGSATGFCCVGPRSAGSMEAGLPGLWAMPLVAGDYLELYVRQNSGANKSIIALEAATTTLGVTRVKG